jgi:hypothetical protein
MCNYFYIFENENENEKITVFNSLHIFRRLYKVINIWITQ